MIFREVEQKIIKIINESGIPIDAIYFIMRSVMQEIEEKYIEYCRIEDTEKMKKEEENVQDENITSIEEEKTEGTN